MDRPPNSNPDASLPAGAKSRQVYLSLLEQISNGHIAEAGKLPGEDQLATTYAVSRVTIRRALDALDRNGWIERRAGSGTRVRPRARPNDPMVMDFATLLPQLAEMGRKTDVRLVSIGVGVTPDHVARALGLTPGAKTQIAVRTRSVNDTPFSYLTTYVPEDIAQGYDAEELGRTPLHVLLEQTGLRITEATQSVSAELAGPQVADALALSEGSALLALERIVRDDTGRAVEYLSGLYRPDMFRLEMSLSRVSAPDGRSWEPQITPLGDKA